MKLSDFDAVDDLMRARKERAAEADAVRNQQKALGVTINGRYQDAEIVDAVRSRVAAELETRIAVIDSRLALLGVKVDA